MPENILARSCADTNVFVSLSPATAATSGARGPTPQSCPGPSPSRGSGRARRLTNDNECGAGRSEPAGGGLMIKFYWLARPSAGDIYIYIYIRPSRKI